MNHQVIKKIIGKKVNIPDESLAVPNGTTHLSPMKKSVYTWYKLKPLTTHNWIINKDIDQYSGRK